MKRVRSVLGLLSDGRLLRPLSSLDAALEILITDVPAEVFSSKFSEAIGPQKQLPLHDKWSDPRYRLTLSI